MALMKTLAVLLVVARLSFTFAAFEPEPLVPVSAPLDTASIQTELLDLGSQAACVALASDTGADKDKHGQCVHSKLCDGQSMLVTQSCAGGTVCCWKLLKEHSKHDPAPPTANRGKGQAEAAASDAGDNAGAQQQDQNQDQEGPKSKSAPAKPSPQQKGQPQPQQRSADNSNPGGNNGGQKPAPGSGQTKDTSHHGKNGNNGNNGNEGKPPSNNGNGNGNGAKDSKQPPSKEPAGVKQRPQSQQSKKRRQQGQKPARVATEPIPGTSNPDKAGAPVKSHTPKGPHHDSQSAPKPQPQPQQNEAKAGAAPQQKPKPGPKF